MITKRILILMWLCTISILLFSNTDNFSLKIDNWDTNTDYTLNINDIFGIKPYLKNIKETLIIVPDSINTKIYNLNIYDHTGFTKIYINDELVANIGTPDQINKNSQIYNESIRVTFKKSLNRVKIVNYSFENLIQTTFEITEPDKSINKIHLYKIFKETIPLIYTLITIFTLITFTLYSASKEKNNRHMKFAFIFFAIYFFSIFFDEQIFLGIELDDIQILFASLAWHSMAIYYIKKHHLWSLKRISFTFLFMASVIVLFSVIYVFNTPKIDILIIKQIAVIFISSSLARIVIKSQKSDELILKIGLVLSIFIQVISFIYLSITNKYMYGIVQTGFLINVLSFYFDFLSHYKDSIKLKDKYNKKIMDSFEKLKQDFNDKDSVILELKSSIEESEREKSQFISTLSSNLRTPLNSIIGYSENLYTTDKTEEIFPIINEIIMESDKMFQSINNIMDFSNKEFTDVDLQLKTFRIKEIFENTLYGSSIINAFKSQINYNAEKDSDKILICGNPRIYKQITTSVFHFLIGLKPDIIDFTITNSGIDRDFMSLVMKFKGNGLDYNDISMEESINNNRDIFSKYIKLYGMKFNEEISDNSYQVEFHFECALAEVENIENKEKKPLDLTLNKNLSVLVVEDYKPNLNIVKMHLTKMGCEVYTATNGEEALTVFNRENIDVVLMDIKMPIMDGWIATESIRSTQKGLDTLILGLTASSLDLDIRHCFESGMDDVLVKPIRKNQLYKKLSTFEDFSPEKFPSFSALRADYRLSKIECEALFKSSISQIIKQLEVIEILTSAEDDKGMNNEMPAIIHASQTINAFYYSRLLRNYFNAYNNRDADRVKELMETLKNTINEVKGEHNDLFRD